MKAVPHIANKNKKKAKNVKFEVLEVSSCSNSMLPWALILQISEDTWVNNRIWSQQRRPQNSESKGNFPAWIITYLLRRLNQRSTSGTASASPGCKQISFSSAVCTFANFKKSEFAFENITHRLEFLLHRAHCSVRFKHFTPALKCNCVQAA